MKKYIWPAILLLTLFLSACQDALEVKPLDIEIIPDRTQIRAGEFVQFDFIGNVDYVMFYSGEDGHEYQYRDRTYMEGGTGTMTFTTLSGPEHDNLVLRAMNLYCSTDFNGTYDYESIQAATWVDLTEQAAWHGGTGSVECPSGNIDLTPFASKGFIYLAYQYDGKATTRQPNWIIRQLRIIYEVGGQTFDIIDGVNKMNSNPGFRFIYPPDQGDWPADGLTTRLWTNNTQQIRMEGRAVATSLYDWEAWAITKGFLLNKVDPDTGEAILDLITKNPYHQHIYEEPGVYNTTFVCKNATIDGEVMELKEFTITVTD